MTNQKNQLPPDWILLGYLTKAHGIKGALSYSLLYPEGESLREGLEIAVVSKTIAYYKIQKILSGYRLQLEGIFDRTSAEKLAHSEIWVKRSSFKELEADEIYLADLIGFEVLDTNIGNLGKVTGFSDHTAQLLMEINGKTLVPFLRPILVKIDEEKQQIWVHLPEEYDL